MARDRAGSSAAGGFVHLRVRSAYSLLEGAIKADVVGKMAADAGMPAVAVTDRANLFGALEFSVTAKDAGVQPLIGCALPVTGVGEGQAHRWARTPTVVLIAQSETGYLNLSALSSMAYLDSDGIAEPCVPWAKVVEHAEGLILLSGGTDGPVDPLFAIGKTAEGTAALAEMARVFGDRFYVELQRHGLRNRRRPRPDWSTGPMSMTFRWWRPTTSISPNATCTTPMTPCCVFRTAPSSARTSGGG